MASSGTGIETAHRGVARRSLPTLSVIIVSYECRELLLGCLLSLASERARLDFEVLLVDNGSTDGTLAMVEDEFPWVETVIREQNVGFAKANNIATHAARADRLLYLNPDTIVPPNALVRAVAELDRRPEIGMLGCKLVRPSGELDHAAKRGFPTPAASLYHFVGLTRLCPSSRRFARYTAGWLGPDEVGLVDAVNGAFMLVRRKALEAVGPMDEDYWLYMEDLDWCYRFWKAGWPILYWPAVEVIHVKGGSTSGGRPWRQNYAFHWGMWHFYRTHQAHERSPVVTLAVWLGIWVKLGVSAAGRVVGRARRS